MHHYIIIFHPKTVYPRESGGISDNVEYSTLSTWITRSTDGGVGYWAYWFKAPVITGLIETKIKYSEGKRLDNLYMQSRQLVNKRTRKCKEKGSEIVHICSRGEEREERN